MRSRNNTQSRRLQHARCGCTTQEAGRGEFSKLQQTSFKQCHGICIPQQDAIVKIVEELSLDAEVTSVNRQYFIQACYKTCDRVGLGKLVRPDGPNNVCSYLPSEKQDPLCGTAIPDLGPKFYMSRPAIICIDGNHVYKVTLPDITKGLVSLCAEGMKSVELMMRSPIIDFMPSVTSLMYKQLHKTTHRLAKHMLAGIDIH